ncbi:uncharacterized protein LOC119883436 [Xyrichtys novacula]|uniref:Uncharacterized protein LOC119883436 n=1 Tax=Xyrichtys novacula TaxID=13765 RepID=A0AAV1FXJ3_XYRNO|nr:uncharacterized protein LOC119883436 [Xyrichtys novacula]
MWLKSSSKVLQEKQKLFNLPQRSLLLDVHACWNSLYLMVERFVEQYAAVQATRMDPRVKPLAERNM